MTRSIGLTATDKKAGIPCCDLARLFAEAAERDPFAIVKVSVGFRNQVQSVTIEFPAPEGTGNATED